MTSGRYYTVTGV